MNIKNQNAGAKFQTIFTPFPSPYQTTLALKTLRPYSNRISKLRTSYTFNQRLFYSSIDIYTRIKIYERKVSQLLSTPLAIKDELEEKKIRSPFVAPKECSRWQHWFTRNRGEVKDKMTFPYLWHFSTPSASFFFFFFFPISHPTYILPKTQ